MSSYRKKKRSRLIDLFVVLMLLTYLLL